MAKITIKVDVPFEWCEGCRMFDLEEDAYETGFGERFILRSCANASICINAHDQQARFYSSKNEGDKDR